MVDYFKVEPDVTRLMNKHFTRGRGGQKIQFIVRHHNAGITDTNQTWNTWQTRAASAHYQIEPNGRVGQLVWDRDTAWANANTFANQRGIAIEHSNSGGANQDWPISNTVIEAGAKWAAALCFYYKLGRPVYGKNIRDHNNFFATGCPWHLGGKHNGRVGKYHDHWMKTAQAHYDWMVAQTSGKPAPAPKPVANEIDAEAEIAKAWLGKPVTEERNAKDGGKYKDYENGSVYWHPKVNVKNGVAKAIAIPANIYEVWAEHNHENGFLGFPTRRHTVVPGVGDIQAFQGGTIYRKYGQEGYPVRGKIGERWADQGFETGPLGWPVSDEYEYGDHGDIRQDFDGGTLLWSPTGVPYMPFDVDGDDEE